MAAEARRAPVPRVTQSRHCGGALRYPVIEPTSRVPAVVHDVLGSSGQPLTAETRAFFEPSFGRDFSGVRIHTDAKAVESAKAVGAAAFALGQNLVFGRGAYDPSTPQGRLLLGHELAHVAQVPVTGTTQQRSLALGRPDDRAERDADVAAHEMMMDRRPSRPEVASAGVLRRQLITPLGQGGGFGGLMERDRRPPGDGSTLEQAASVPAAIQGGWRRIAELDTAAMSTANVDQRLAMLEALIRAYWTGNAEEEAIIRIVRSTPLSQSTQTLRVLDDRTLDGKRYLDELHRVADLGNNLELHAALSELRMKAMGAEKGTPALVAAPVLPWHDVMGFFEDAATFSVSRTSDKKVRVTYPTYVYRSTDFANEIQRLPVDLFISGFDYEADQILVIHDYDQGRFVPVVAEELIGYQAAGVRGFLGHAATAVSFAVPTSAARTVVGKVAVIALERILPAAFLLIDENRLNIVKWFPNWGPRMLYYADLAKIGFGIYGIARFGVSGWQMFRSWRQIRQARRAMDPLDAGAEAEQIAAALEREADRIFDEVDKLNVGRSPTEPARLATGPEASAEAAAVRRPPAGTPAEPLTSAQSAEAAAVRQPQAGTPAEPLTSAPSATSGPERGGRIPPVPGEPPDFPFATGRELPKPERPDRLYRIMSNAEAAATLRAGKVQAAQGTGGQMGHKFFSLDARYSALFKPAQLGRAQGLGQQAAAAERAGDATRAAQLRAEAAELISKWHAAPGQTVIVEIELEPGALEQILRRSVTEPRLDAHRGADVFIYKFERGAHNIAVPSWQVDRFNAHVKAVQLYGWRAPFGPGQIPKGVQ
jgi:hypothetical protein